MRSALPESLAANRPEHALKTYVLVRSPKYGPSEFEFQHEGSSIIWIVRDSGLFQSTQFRLHAGASNGPVLATAKMPSWSGGVRVQLDSPSEVWEKVHIDKVKKPRRAVYVFESGGREFCWRMTHSKGLGVESFGDLALELLDLAHPEQVLAAFVTEKKLGKKKDVAGKVEFYVELGKELEALALAVVWGVDEMIRRNRSSSSSGAAAAAAGAAASAGGGGGGGC